MRLCYKEHTNIRRITLKENNKQLKKILLLAIFAFSLLLNFMTLYKSNNPSPMYDRVLEGRYRSSADTNLEFNFGRRYDNLGFQIVLKENWIEKYIDIEFEKIGTNMYSFNYEDENCLILWYDNTFNIYFSNQNKVIKLIQVSSTPYTINEGK